MRVATTTAVSHQSQAQHPPRLITIRAISPSGLICQTKKTPDEMNSCTAGRFQVRRAHLRRYSDDNANHSSTCSTDDENDTILPSAPLKPNNGSDAKQSKEGAIAAVEVQLDDSFDNIEDYVLEPKITARYPKEDHLDQPLNICLPQFCHPEGTDFIHPSEIYKIPRILHFVLTDSMGTKQYGMCLAVYE